MAAMPHAQPGGLDEANGRRAHDASVVVGSYGLTGEEDGSFGGQRRRTGCGEENPIRTGGLSAKTSDRD